MKKLSLVLFAALLLGLGGCSSTSDVAKADAKETNKSASKSKRSKSRDTCDSRTGSRLSKKC
ncbi:MAG: hypothetical protein ACFHVJ_09230 [Aestuariibacter sp.]